MELSAELEAPCPPGELFTWVDDLTRYPAWLTIVSRAEPFATTPPGSPAWSVDLRGRIGPFARSKRLRMERTGFEPERLAVFERREADGRQHAPWELRAEVWPSGAGSRLVMALRYGGSLWGPVLERLLADEISDGRLRLLALVSPPMR